MNELAHRGYDVTIVSSEVLSAERRSMGWVAPSVDQCRLVVAPGDQQIKALISHPDPEMIHVIAGARGTPLGRTVASQCISARKPFGIITEAPDSRGFGGLLRRVKYAHERQRIGRNVSFIMAMGQIGVDWFTNCGYPASSIYPFSYVTGAQDIPSEPRAVDQAIYVGRLLRLKGIDLLLRALANLPGKRLTIIGDGPERSRLQRLARRIHVNERITWEGNHTGPQVAKFIASSSLLVLPSRKDGWGAVINEALMLGTPVVCSSACGASDLIRRTFLGSVFRSGDVADLANKMMLSFDAAIEGEGFKRTLDWTEAIATSKIADYFEQIVRHAKRGGPRPIAPWRTQTTGITMPLIVQ